jgi:hypothetical protein
MQFVGCFEFGRALRNLTDEVAPTIPSDLYCTSPPPFAEIDDKARDA